ncbi:ABC transporter permease subunit [Psittacicella gerlachiana]|uniref:ABC transmembrane type-1 domain-containing protein n=1 Tax=Psittacicella gerlachiana TaxID=2028574 RepID=A0A3A1YN59_9GAMM|nr:ABC transporter permease subunit [Psittacicella gerlachiana]RIY38420.1 hypothetical protein CKF59_00985 [Psittacicella gerlachiana]
MKRFKWQEISLAWVILAFIVIFYAISLTSLFVVRPAFDLNSSSLDSWQDLWQIISQVSGLYLKNTLWQASLSASIIIVLSYILAKAIYYLSPRFTSWLLTITNASFSLPTILVVFAFIAIFGQDGWINSLLTPWDYKVSIYGLGGILIANTYFNLGYATSAIYNGMQKIPVENIKLAQICNFTLGQQLRHLELPYLKNTLLNLWLLIFMLCFNSFALVLFLGGPRYSNFEVAIYNSLVTEGNFTKACVIASLQIIFSLVLIVLISMVRPNNKQHNVRQLQEYNQEQSYLGSLWPRARLKKVASYLYASSAIFFIGLPLLSLVLTGVKSAFFLYQNYQLQQTDSSLRAITGDTFSYPWLELWQATKMSLIIAGGATLVCLLCSILLLRGLRWLGSYTAQWINNLSLLSIVIPSMLLGAGYFLFLNLGVDIAIGTWGFITLIVLANAFAAIVFSLNYLYPAYMQIQSYAPLAMTIGLNSWQSFFWYELPLLKYSLLYAAITVFILSLGDYSIILFFVNNQQISSITYLLSNQLNSFASNQGNITAMALLLGILLLRFIAYYFLHRGYSKVGKSS